MTYPQVPGFVPVPTPGTPVALATNASTTQTQGVFVRAFSVQAMRAADVVNTGDVFIGIAGMNKTTGAGVISKLVPGASQVFGSNIYDGSKDYDLTQLFVDAVTATDGVQVSVF